MSKLSQLRNSDFIEKCNKFLTDEELSCMTIYIESNGLPLSAALASQLYELFLNGSNCLEISRLNKGVGYGAILDARIRYDWDRNQEEYASELHGKIRQKVIKAQLETTELLTDALVAAKKKHGDKLKKYIQTGDENHLDGGLNIDSIAALNKLTEGLLKITGQDKPNKDEPRLVNINTSQPKATSSGGTLIPGPNNQAHNNTLDSEDAAAVLEIFARAEEKKKNV